MTTKVKKQKSANQLAIYMAIALLIGLIVGAGCIFLRESLMASGQGATWNTINSIFFQDITAPGGEKALGIFYILGQMFIRSLQLVIVPMVFTSIALAMCTISDTKKLGRISYKTIKNFLIMYIAALLLAGIVGFAVYHMGFFNVELNNLTAAAGTAGANPLLVILNAVPSNIGATFSNNGAVLSLVLLAVACGLAIHTLGEKVTVLKKIMQEINDIVTMVLTFIITRFGPIAIFVLISRTFAIYGIEHLKPALAYVIATVCTLVVFLIFGYAIFIRVVAKLNPKNFIKKMAKVAMFGFSTSSSAATLPLNTKTTVEELGVSQEVASFTLPLGMTVNMNGTAIMQVIAAIFIAASAGYDVTVGNILIIALLALIASVGTPAAPGAGAIILFTVLTGMGYTNDAALLAYSLILAINRPIEMLVTSLNVVGDSAAAVAVAKSENIFDEEIYNG
ncbi:MAG: dicarboxylate/amino acid:cation symporter [Erysipelotrichaceae bacterium]